MSKTQRPPIELELKWVDEKTNLNAEERLIMDETKKDAEDLIKRNWLSWSDEDWKRWAKDFEEALVSLAELEPEPAEEQIKFQDDGYTVVRKGSTFDDETNWEKGFSAGWNAQIEHHITVKRNELEEVVTQLSEVQKLKISWQDLRRQILKDIEDLENAKI